MDSTKKIQKKRKANALATAVIVFISFVMLGIVYGPILFGLRAYSIETGSMAPTIPEGSLVFVKECNDFSDYAVNDIVTFSDGAKTKYFTHRIVEIDDNNLMFTTKGDANPSVDETPVDYYYAIGKVQISVPFLGFVSTFFKNKIVKIAVAVLYIAWAAIEIEVFIMERKKRDE